MLTCKSPRKVMLVAHQLARQFLPSYTGRFSRHDFTLPQLFACLAVKELLGRSYRGAESLLRDCPHWCHAIGMRKAPDHNTLCRAAALLGRARVARALDACARWARHARVLKLRRRVPNRLFTAVFDAGYRTGQVQLDGTGPTHMTLTRSPHRSLTSHGT